MEIKTVIYKTDSDKEPFTEWRKGLDFQIQGIVSGRLTRVRAGNLGSCKPIKGWQGLHDPKLPALTLVKRPETIPWI